jgi:3-phenylpropionate/trans-cinnamate dioxygenase ferredoxin subunit
MPERFVVCRVDELPAGQRRIVEVAGRSIGVFNIDGEYHAIRNACPHQLAPLCLGSVSGTSPPTDRVGDYRWHRQGQIIRCPWHGWEFDITTGQSLFNPHKCRVKHYEVTVESTRTPRQIDSTDPDPSVETYPVVIEAKEVVLYVG